MSRPAGRLGRKMPRLDKRQMVRCLGPGKEHYFPSADRMKNRVCPACQKLLHNTRVVTFRGGDGIRGG